MANNAYLAIANLLASRAVHDDTGTRNQLAWRRWAIYCRKLSIDPSKAPDVDTAIGFVAFLMTLPSLTVWSSFKGMIEGVKAEMELKTISTQSFYHGKFKRVIVGLRRTINVNKDKKKKSYRAFCEPSLLHSILPYFRTNTVAQRNAKRTAIIASAGAHRLGELVATKHNRGNVPLEEDIKVVDRNRVSVFLQRSKPDRVHKGTLKKVSDLLTPFSVVRAVQECRAEKYANPPQGTPFFCNERRQALTDDAVMKELHLALKAAGHSTKGFTTKCFRRGSARSMKKKGGSKQDIRKLGGWSQYSNCYKTYIESDTSDFDDDYILPNRNKRPEGYHITRNKQDGRKITLRRGVTS